MSKLTFQDLISVCVAMLIVMGVGDWVDADFLFSCVQHTNIQMDGDLHLAVGVGVGKITFKNLCIIFTHLLLKEVS